MRADTLQLVVRAYRVMAYVTGVVLMVLVFVGIPLQVWANNLIVVRYVGTAHGFLYIVYVLVAFAMTRAVRMPVASPRTVIVLLAGTIPMPDVRGRALGHPHATSTRRWPPPECPPREHPVLR